MAVAGGILGQLGRWLQRFTPRHPPQWFIDWVGGGASAAGVTVGHQKALQYTPFWAAVRIISGTLGALPFKVYRRLENSGKESLPGHPVYALVHERANPYIDWVTFAETRMAHVLCYGNGYAEIQRDGAGRPVALWPLLPNRTSRALSAEGIPYYRVQLASGEQVEIADENVLHIKGLGFDGYTGYDVVTYHKEALGYGIAVREYGARFFANDANPGGVLECPVAMTDAAYQRLKAEWEAKHAGLSQAHRMAILEEGTKWAAMGIEPAKAQALEVQKWTVDDCSRIFQIPPHKLGSMEFSKYNNVEQLQLDFMTTTMLYWFRKWEQEINYKLLSARERGTVFVEILADAMLRGNTEARTKYYAAGRQWGFLSINDIRAKENMNPIGPEGDLYLDPLNMRPAGAPGPEPEQTPDVVRAHQALIETQWRRVLHRVKKASAKGTRNGFWPKERATAREILIDAVRAWAALTRAVNAEAALDELLAETLAEDRPIDETDAGPLAQRLMERMGGRDHALAKA